MDIHTKRVTITLARRELLAIEIEAQTRVYCAEGCLWITQNQDCSDTLLGAGEVVILASSGSAVIQALRESRFVVTAPGTLPSRLAGAAQPLIVAGAKLRRLAFAQNLLRACGLG